MKDERGSVSVVVAGLVAIAMVMAMAAADVVRVLAAASRGQTAADAAALAAAQTLALPDDVSPGDRAREYAEGTTPRSRRACVSPGRSRRGSPCTWTSATCCCSGAGGR